MSCSLTITWNLQFLTPLCVRGGVYKQHRHLGKFWGSGWVFPTLWAPSLKYKAAWQHLRLNPSIRNNPLFNYNYFVFTLFLVFTAIWIVLIGISSLVIVYEHKICSHFKVYCLHLPAVINISSVKNEPFHSFVCNVLPGRLIAVLLPSLPHCCRANHGFAVLGKVHQRSGMQNNGSNKYQLDQALCSGGLHRLGWQSQLLASSRLDSPGASEQPGSGTCFQNGFWITRSPSWLRWQCGGAGGEHPCLLPSRNSFS